MITARALAIVALAFVAGCSSPAPAAIERDAGALDASGDDGPTWLDSSPATLDYDAEAPGDAEDAADVTRELDAATAPACVHKGSCGGSWERYACPRAYVPPYDSHCSLDSAPDAGATFEWCCYGSRVP